MFDPIWFDTAAGPPDSDDVEAGRDAQQLLTLQVPQRCARYPALLRFIHSIGGMSRLGCRVRFDFDKDDSLAALVNGDQIDFTRFVRFAFGDHNKTLATKESRRGLFTPFANRSGWINAAISPIDVGSTNSI